MDHRVQGVAVRGTFVAIVPSLALVLGALAFPTTTIQAAANPSACWGEATQALAQMGEMGEHASQQPTPRLGLRNLARALADAGLIEDDTMQALGAFVAVELGLSLDACR
jgi:hypothetical protein